MTATAWSDEEKALVRKLVSDGELNCNVMAQVMSQQLGSDKTVNAVYGWMQRNKYTGMSKSMKGYPPEADVADDRQKDKEITGLEKENAVLRQQLLEVKRRREQQYNIHRYNGKYVRFGVLGDTQLSSYYENLNLLNLAYDVYARDGIERVYHTGDLVDGEKMYRGQEYEIHTHGAKRQREYCIETYPQRPGIMTHFIGGNHDASFWKRSGVEIGEEIASRRPDMQYEGFDEADIPIETETGKITLRLCHPGKGTAYAISYQIQTYINSLTGGEKPNILLVGHYHKVEHLFYRNIEAFQTGCMQYQTPFMKRRNIPAVQGFWIVELVLDDDSIVRCKGEFFPCYV